MTEAELLFTEILKCNRLSLYLNNKSLLDKKNGKLVASVLKRRINGEPLQYILARTEFMGLEFKVAADVFIPRPETELVVEEAINKFKVQGSMFKVIDILDLGTGCGCIAVSLARFLPQAKIVATDISGRALAIARENAVLNNVEEKIRFIQSDLFSDCVLRSSDYNMIISNPPYIPSQNIDNLQAEVRYEPRLALDGGKDGLDFYRRIIAQAPIYLKENGLLIMEMGLWQFAAIKNIFQKTKNFEIIEVAEDYNDIRRVIVAKNMMKNG